MAEWHSSVEGPRWAGLPAFIADCARATEVGVSWSIDKSFLRTVIVFTVTGTDEAVESFKLHYYAGLRAYGVPV